MDRRDFIEKSATLSLAAMLSTCGPYLYAGQSDSEVGNMLRKWRRGEFEVHFIYTGAAESIFMIFPDGTSMLLDCGEQDTQLLGKRAVPRKPDGSRMSGEWVARYVQRVNPHGKNVDYMMLSHYHCDHAGCDTVYVPQKEGVPPLPYRLSGFGQAAQYLHFSRAFDRCWPDYTEPIPLLDDKKSVKSQMKAFYDYMHEHEGLEIERFMVGAKDQVRLLHSPSSYPSFSVRNICGNGYIASPDGSITDLYAGEKEGVERINENGFSLGMIFSYGPFRYYTAGDFSHRFKRSDGTSVDIEKELAKVVEACQVSKLNHHGHISMPTELVSALKSRIYISSTWNTRHCTDDTLEHLMDKSAYQGERMVCPCFMPSTRLETLKENSRDDLLGALCHDCFEPCHVVLRVGRGGRRYSVSYISAADESMTVRSVMRFNSV